MRMVRTGAVIALAAFVGGCGTDSGTTGSDVVETVDGRSAVDSLLALVQARARSSDPEVNGAYIDFRQARRIRISVDGRAWGLYSLGEPSFEKPSGGADFLLHTEPSQAVLVASLSEELSRSDEPLDTVADWVSLLELYLAPGGHVATIEELTIEQADGTNVTVQPRLLIPFTIAQGDSTAYLGEIVIDVDVPGGEE